jgi:beta-catenin-like protein 1
MREAAESKLRSVDKDIASERRASPTTYKLGKILTRQVMAINEEEVSDEDELEWYSRRLDAGLSSLQNADYVLAWVCMEEDGVSFSLPPKGAELISQARAHAHTMLRRKDQSFTNIVRVLEGEHLHRPQQCGIADE